MPEIESRSFPLIDTHTGGEITRVVMGQAIGLSAGSPKDHLAELREQRDWLRRSLTSEPRGSAFAVGAVVTPSSNPGVWSVVFFNNVGYLGMCGHGLIGVVEALRHAGQITDGTHTFATPPGDVTAILDARCGVTFTGVRSWCERQDVSVVCADGGEVVGDIAYGGNWFFLVRDDAVATANVDELTARCHSIRDALTRQNLCGAGGAEIDHVELYCSLGEGSDDSSVVSERGSRNFVLCPGGHYDRSPCGTGTSAKLATLAAKGELQPGQPWIQQSVTGSRFIASYQPDDCGVRVTISGRAHVTAETVQIYDPEDALRFGLGAV